MTDNTPSGAGDPSRAGTRRISLRSRRVEAGDSRCFSILVVCTANHCRSPIMDAIWTTRARDRFGPAWQVLSAGTDARPGQAPHPFADKALSAAGFAPTVTAARAVEAGLIRSADLVLTAERRHRAEVATQVPSAVSHLFTLREFARLASSVTPFDAPDPVSAGRELVIRARQARADHPPVDATEDDLVDPMGLGQTDFADCVRTVTEAVDRALRVFGPASPPGG